MDNAYAQLIKYIQEMKWGEITIVVKDGVPVMVKRREDIKLSDGIEVTGL